MQVMKTITKIGLGALLGTVLMFVFSPAAAAEEDSDCGLLQLGCVLDPILDPIIPDPEPDPDPVPELPPVVVEEPPVEEQPPVVSEEPVAPPAQQPSQPAPAPEKPPETPSAPAWQPSENFTATSAPRAPRATPAPEVSPFIIVDQFMPTATPTPAPTPVLPGKTIDVFMTEADHQFGPAVEFDRDAEALPYLLTAAALTCALISVGLFMALVLRKQRSVR